MDDLYDEVFPDVGPNCAQHSIPLREEPTCAWVEGFADWYGSAVLNNPDIAGHGNIDTATWGTPGWDNGDQVEGRIAGALWDLDDAGSEVWDNIDESLENIWDTMLDNRPLTFREYWTQHGQGGHNVGDDRRRVGPPAADMYRPQLPVRHAVRVLVGGGAPATGGRRL